MDNMDRQLIEAWLEDICGIQPEVQDLEAIKSVIEELISEAKDAEVYNVGK